MTVEVVFDWEDLRAAATAARELAYCPYSDFPVGAAGVINDGRIITSCNVENASYGLSLCAECGLVSALHASGGGLLVAVAIVDKNDQPLMPCGRCRQLLLEAGGPELQVLAAEGSRTLGSLLPDAFSEDDLH